MDQRLVVTEDDAPDLRRLLLRELAPMLYPPGPAPRPCWICVAVPGPDGAPRGGLIGLAVGAWLKIELVWLPTEMRGRGLGGKLLIEAEKRAAAGGCIGSTVTTSSSKACRFYERYGYIIRLQLPDARPEYTQVTLQKSFK